MCSDLATILPHKLTAPCLDKAADLNVLLVFFTCSKILSKAEIKGKVVCMWCFLFFF